MLRRVHFDDWQAIITIVAFVLCFSTFLWFAFRALRMRRSERDHLSNLPLEQDEDSPVSNHNEQR